MSEAIQLTRLPSGLTVVTERMERVETVSLGAYVATGSRHEQEAENGVSHFLEHMAFKGTERRSAAQIAEEIEAVGGHINAYTAREQTAYYVKVLKEDTALAADIIGDILTHSTFEPEELERERGVILQEIGQANDTPDDIIFDHFQEQRLSGTAARPAGAGVRARHPLDAAHHADRLHAPPLRRAQRGGGGGRRADPPAGARSGQRALRRPAASIRCRRCCRRNYGGGEFREARDLDQVHIVLGFPSVGYGDRDYYPTLLLSTLLGGGMSSRLFQEVREKRGLVYSIYSFSSPFLDGGLFGIYAGTGESEAEELMPVTLDGAAQGADRGDRGGAGAGAGAGEGEPADVAGEHRQPLRAARPAVAGVRPGGADRGDGREDQCGDHERCLPRRGAAVPRRADVGHDGPGRAGADAGEDRGEAGRLKSCTVTGLSLAKRL